MPAPHLSLDIFTPPSQNRAAPPGFLAVAMGVLALFCLMALNPARAAADLPVSALEDGGLFFPGDGPDRLSPAPLLATDIHVDVSGLVARYRLTHRFTNPGESWTEAVYSYPLPEDAAVDRLTIRVGERVIEGEIQEKQRAKETYEAAKAEGRKAGLVQQHRPNLFTTSLANIAPGEMIEVEIGFQEVLSFRSGLVDLALPLVIGPRYLTGTDPMIADGSGWITDEAGTPVQVRHSPPEAASDLPDMGRMAYTDAHNPVRLTIDLFPGFEVAALDSATHDIISKPQEGGFQVTLNREEGESFASRDFVLTWKPKVPTAAQAALFAERIDGETFGFLMLTPKPLIGSDDLPAKDRQPREVVFVIDVSGSMEGASILQAKAALERGLRRLAPDDRFNLVAFNHEARVLFPDLIRATPANLARALEALGDLRADGGTEISFALEAALGFGEAKALRQVILITDGSVSNEEALFSQINRDLGEQRLFTVGIGSAPNRYFMTRAAEMGRGSFTHIASLDEVEGRMAEMFHRLEQPALTDLSLSWPDGVVAETAPRVLPDLYAGEPVMVAFKLADKPEQPDADLVIAGRYRGNIWTQSVGLAPSLFGADTEQPKGLATLYARSVIRDAMAARARGQDPDLMEAKILETALTHGLVSAYTSLVAVDRSEVPISPRPDDETLETKEVPRHLPDGWTEEGVFGEPAQAQHLQKVQKAAQSTSMQMAQAAAPAKAQMTRRFAPGVVAVQTLGFPQTATPALLNGLIGLALLVFAAIGFWCARRILRGQSIRAAGLTESKA